HPFSYLTLRPPPSPTLFPYTTLFRSRSALCFPEYFHRADRTGCKRRGNSRCRMGLARPRIRARRSRRPRRTALERGHRLLRHRRSEEHTSELQSLAYLVCRLLLEKKK